MCVRRLVARTNFPDWKHQDWVHLPLGWRWVSSADDMELKEWDSCTSPFPSEIHSWFKNHPAKNYLTLASPILGYKTKLSVVSVAPYQKPLLSPLVLEGGTLEQRFPGRPWRFLIISLQWKGTPKRPTAEVIVSHQFIIRPLTGNQTAMWIQYIHILEVVNTQWIRGVLQNAVIMLMLGTTKSTR